MLYIIYIIYIIYIYYIIYYILYIIYSKKTRRSFGSWKAWRGLSKLFCAKSAFLVGSLTLQAALVLFKSPVLPLSLSFSSSQMLPRALQELPRGSSERSRFEKNIVYLEKTTILGNCRFNLKMLLNCSLVSPKVFFMSLWAPPRLNFDPVGALLELTWDLMVSIFASESSLRPKLEALGHLLGQTWDQLGLHRPNFSHFWTLPRPPRASQIFQEFRIACSPGCPCLDRSSSDLLGASCPIQGIKTG